MLESLGDSVWETGDATNPRGRYIEILKRWGTVSLRIILLERLGHMETLN